MNDLGKKLRNIREKLGMSQQDVAEKSGIGYKTINNYEKGVSRPDVEKLAILCEVFHVSADYFISHKSANKKFNYYLNADEISVIEKYKILSPASKDAVVDSLVSLKKIEDQFKQQQTDQHKAELQAIKEEYESTVMNQPDNIIQFYDEKQNHEQQVELNYRTGGAGAGLGVDADNVDMIQVSYPADRVPAGANHVIPVSGDSMEPTFSDGDVLFFDLGNDCLQIGDIGIFVLNGETLVKELGENELISHNPKYKPIKIHEWDSVRIEGKVLGKM